jgi:D-2-hydroxyacid dehydrogenase (NADP+)
VPPESSGAGKPCIVAVDTSLEDRHAAMIEAVDPRVRVVRVSGRRTWLAEAPDAEIILGFRPLREAALASRRLRWVQALGAGVENLSQDVAGTEIRITNVHVHGDAVADHVLALVLAHTCRLPCAFALQAARRWGHDEVRGTALAGRTLGVLGLGTIGAAVARRAAAFGMRVIGTKRHPSPVPHVAQVFPPERLDAVLQEASVLALTLPLTAATRGILGRREIALLPRGAFVVNVGRGGLVDEPALVAALREGLLGGAGLDVFAEEPLPPDSPLWRLPRVIITPHVAGDVEGYMDRMIPVFCANLRRYLAGQPLEHQVDPARGY